MDERTRDDRVLLLRRHCMNLAGYAFSLARRQGLSPEDALRLWMGPAMQRSNARPLDAQTWVARNAAAMEIFHGDVSVTQVGKAWVMRVEVTNELEPLSAWNAVDYWVAWITEQARIVAKPHGLHVSSRLDGATLTFQFGPGDDSV
jgi:hypothetical protein